MSLHRQTSNKFRLLKDLFLSEICYICLLPRLITGRQTAIWTPEKVCMNTVDIAYTDLAVRNQHVPNTTYTKDKKPSNILQANLL